MIIKGATG